MSELKMRDGGYKSITCEHRADILTCPECDILGKGVYQKVPYIWHPVRWAKAVWWNLKQDWKIK